MTIDNTLSLKARQKGRQEDRVIKMFPMLCVQGYLTFTVLLFAFGAWPWPVNEPVKLYSFLILAQIALLSGYLKALNHRPTVYVGRWSWHKLLKIGFWLNLLWIIPNYNNRLHLESFDPYEMVSRMKLALSNPGMAYQLKQAGEIVGGSFIVILSVLVAPFLQLLIPIAITYWQHISQGRRVLIVAFILIDLSSWIAAGTNQGIAELILLLPFFIIARSPMSIKGIWARRNLLIMVFSIMFVISFMAFFSKGMVDRLGKTIPTLNYAAGIEADQLNFLSKMTENQIVSTGILMLSSYLTQGYYGLALSLEQPFQWCYGLGHSYYLPVWYKKIDPSAQFDLLSYPGRVETQSGWGYFLRFNSIYPWFASDVTFPGTLVVMFLFGYLFSKLWQDILWCKNPIALSLSSIMILLLVYIPINNRLGFAPTASAFWVLLIWWWHTRRITS